MQLCQEWEGESGKSPSGGRPPHIWFPYLGDALQLSELEIWIGMTLREFTLFLLPRCRITEAHEKWVGTALYSKEEINYF